MAQGSGIAPAPTSLPSALPVEGGHRIDTATREWMEGRFGESLGDVRVHTGAGAAAAASALGARAFTLAENVFFGRGQYAPRTSSGRRLLAHELTHVLQQRRGRAARSAGSPLAGSVAADLDDPLELEAEEVAERVLTGGRPGAISPDASGMVRRAVKVDPSTAQIKVDKSPRAKPAVNFFAGTAICHLTEGFHPFMPPSAYGNAFRLEGSVSVSLGPGDSLSGWQFNFIQFMEVKFIGYFYAGAAEADGAIAIRPHRVSSLKKLSLDAEPPNVPFTDRFPFAFRGGRAINRMADHPSIKGGLELTNRVTKKRNFICQIIDDRAFWSIFSARDPQGTLMHLAHVQWRVRYEARFVWRGGQPVGTMAAGARLDLQQSNSKQGPPTEKGLQGMLASPGGPTSNVMVHQAIQKAVLGGRPARVDHDRRSAIPIVPPNFFR